MANWFSSYRYRFKFTIDADNIDADLVDFPVALHVNSSCGTGDGDLTMVFDIVGARWHQICVCGADGRTPLWTEVDTWDASGETGVLHVRVPKISSSEDTDLYLYFDVDGFGNGYIGAPGSSAAAAVWDQYFVGVWHMALSATGYAYDSTSHNTTGVLSGSGFDSGDELAGLCGNALDFDGVDDLVTCTDSDASLDVTDALTLEVLCNRDAHDSDGEGIVNKQDAPANSTYGDYFIIGSSTDERVWFGLNENAKAISADGVLVNGSWVHLAGTYDKSNLYLYANGTQAATDTWTTAITTGSTKLTMGRYWGTPVSGFNGKIDEVRVSSVARSAAWIAATSDTLADSLGAYDTVEVISAAPHGSWLSTWHYRQKITIAQADILSSGSDVVTALTFDGTSGASLFAELGENSDKIAVTDHTGVRQCFVDVKSWSGAGTAAELHVTVPSIDGSTDVTLYLYFDVNQADNDGFVGSTAATVSATSYTIGALESFTGTGWCRGFSKRHKVSIAATNIDAVLDYFPVTLFLSSSCGTGTQDMTAVFDEVGANYKKIAVTSADGKTQLPVEIDYWDEGSEVAVLHVRVPSVDSEASTDLYLYYSADVPDNDEFVGDIAEAPAMSVWDADFKAVYHMGQDPSAATIKDSTVSANHLTSSGTMLTGDLVDSAPAKGIDFDGTDDVLYSTVVPVSAYPCTFEMKGKCEADGPGMGVADNSETDEMMYLRVVTDTILKASVMAYSTSISNAYGTAELSAGTNYYLAGTMTSSTSRSVFTNGADKQTDTTDIGFPTNVDRFAIGGFLDSTPVYLDGDVSEARVSSVVRSDAWIKATHYSLSDGLVSYTADVEAEDVWLGTWANRLQIRIDSSLIDGDLTDFPVAIQISASAGQGSRDLTAIFDELGANSHKIAITDESGDQLFTEIEVWDNSAETATLHVKVPTVYQNRDTLLYFYYDSSQSDNDTYIGDTGDAAAQSVWDAYFSVVYHMANDPSGGAGAVLDSTSNGLDLTSGGTMLTEDLVAGPVGKAIDFDGTDDYLYSADSAMVSPSTGTFTLEAMIKTSHDHSAAELYALGNYGVDTDNVYGLSIYTDNKVRTFWRDASGDSMDASAVGVALNDGVWRHIAGVRTAATTCASYTNGVAGDTGSNGSIGAIDTSAGAVPVYGCLNWGGTPGQFFFGSISEIRISKGIARSAAWLKATYNTLFDALVAYSTPLALDGDHHWAPGWAYRRAFAVPATNIDGDLDDFPVAMILGTSVGTGDADISSIFDTLSDHSKRILVTTNNGKPLPVEIDNWDESSEVAAIHFKAPHIDAAYGASFYLYYDDDRYDSGNVGDTGDAIAQRVWDDDFDAVWHMNGDPSVGSDIQNSKADTNHLTGVNMESGDLGDSAVIGKQVDLDGSNEWLVTALSGLPLVNGAKTAEIVHNSDATARMGCGSRVTYGGVDNTAKGWVLSLDTTQRRMYNTGDGECSYLTGYTADVDEYFAATCGVNGADATLHLNASELTPDTDSLAAGTAENTSGFFAIGWETSTNYANGQISEVRLSSAQRSAAWLKATYYTLFDGLGAWGTETEEGEEEPATLEETVGLVTVELAPVSLTDTLSITEALGKVSLEATLLSIGDTYIGNVLKMLDASGSRPRIASATGSTPGLSTAKGARPRLAAAEAFAFQEIE